MRRPPKDVNLVTRVTRDERQKFHVKAAPYGNASEVLRELAKAFIEDRLVIRPPVNSEKETLYVPRIED